MSTPKHYYSLHDKVAQTWSTPFESTNQGVAARAFLELFAFGKNELISNHIQDFDLYYIYDLYYPEEVGESFRMETFEPRRVITGVEVQKQTQKMYEEAKEIQKDITK